MNGFKKMFFGEKMPDKNDPKYAEKYEKQVEAGRAFARKFKIDLAGAYLQKQMENHRKIFLFLLFSFVFSGFALVSYRLVDLFSHRPVTSSAVRHQQHVLQERRDSTIQKISEQKNTQYDENTPEN